MKCNFKFLLGLIFIGYIYIVVNSVLRNTPLVSPVGHLKMIGIHFVDFIKSIFGKYIVDVSIPRKVQNYYLPSDAVLTHAVRKVHTQMRNNGWVRSTYNEGYRPMYDYCLKFQLELKACLLEEQQLHSTSKIKPPIICICKGVLVSTFSPYVVMVETMVGKSYFTPLPEERYETPIRLTRTELGSLIFI